MIHKYAQAIKKIIEACSADLLERILTNFNQPDSAVSREHLGQVLKALSANCVHFYSLDYQGIFSKALSTKLYTIPELRLLFEAAIKGLFTEKQRFFFFEKEVVVVLARYAATQNNMA